MKKKAIIPVLVILAASAGYAAWHSGQQKASSNTFAHTGTVEAVEVAVSFQIPGKVETVLFEEGASVQEGRPLASLDRETLDEEVTRARAALQSAQSRRETAKARALFLEKAVQAQIRGAEANLEKLTAGLRPQEVETARQNLEKAQAQADRARDEAARALKLYEEGVVPRVKMENALTTAQVAEATLSSAREALDLARSGTREEDLRVARATLQSAQARSEEVRAARLEARAAGDEVQLREAEVRLALARQGYATLLAPLSGVVLSRNVEPGENVPAGRPVFTLADLSRVKVRFYIAAEELGTLKHGDPVRVISDSFPAESFEGQVAFISEQAEFTPKSIQTREERTKLVYMVRALVPNPDRRLKPGMPVDAVLAR